MGRVFIKHPDEVAWGPRTPVPSGPGGRVMSTHGRSKLIGDPDKGPWVISVEVDPEYQPPIHSHSTDEHIYVLEGEMRLGKRVCKPGTVIYVEKDTQYTFTAGPQGVKFLNFRPGPASFEIVQQKS